MTPHRTKYDYTTIAAFYCQRHLDPTQPLSDHDWRELESQTPVAAPAWIPADNNDAGCAFLDMSNPSTPLFTLPR